MTVHPLSILLLNQYSIFAAIAISAGLYCCWSGYRLLERKRRLMSVPTSTVAETTMIDAQAISNSVGHDPSIGLSSAAADTSRSANPETDAHTVGELEVIRLEGGFTASNSHEMTQQAKIAAALSRAGITRPEAWLSEGDPQESPLRVDAITETTDGSRTVDDAASLTDPSDRASGVDARSLVMMKGTDDIPFVLSYRSRQELIRTVSLNSVAMICGGAALAILGVLLLVFQP